MKLAVLFISSLFLFACSANRNVYKSADFESQAARHRTIAVLPIQVVQTGHKGKNYNEEAVKEANDKWSRTFQESLHAYLLRHTSRNKKGQVINFQSLQKTNSILQENGLKTDDLYTKKPEELAKLLGVDAVLMTTVENEKNFSDGVAYGLAITRTILFAAGSTKGALLNADAANINMNSYLYDAADSKLLWQTFRKGGTDLPTRVDDLVEYYSNWIAKKFPYKS